MPGWERAIYTQSGKCDILRRTVRLSQLLKLMNTGMCSEHGESLRCEHREQSELSSQLCWSGDDFFEIACSDRASETEFIDRASETECIDRASETACIDRASETACTGRARETEYIGWASEIGCIDRASKCMYWQSQQVHALTELASACIDRASKCMYWQSQQVHVLTELASACIDRASKCMYWQSQQVHVLIVPASACRHSTAARSWQLTWVHGSVWDQDIERLERQSCLQWKRPFCQKITFPMTKYQWRKSNIRKMINKINGLNGRS